MRKLSRSALGCLLVAEALRRRADGTSVCIPGLISLSLMALTIMLIALWNNHDRKPADDFGVQMILVYAFSALFPALASLLAKRVDELFKGAVAISWAAAVIWIGAGSGYSIVPDEFKGLIERVVLTLPIVWLAGMSWLLIQSRPTRDTVDAVT